MCASRHGHTATVQVLLDAKADADVQGVFVSVVHTRSTFIQLQISDQ